MKWQFIEDVSDGKGSEAYEAINFYANLKSKDYAGFAVDKLKDNLWRLQDDSERFIVEPINDYTEVSLSSLKDFIEIVMADCVIEFNNQIPQDWKMRKPVWQSKNVISSLLDFFDKKKKKFNLNHIPKDKAKDIVEACLWNYDDEIMAIQGGIRQVMGYVMGLHVKSMLHFDIENSFISVHQIAQLIDNLGDGLDEITIPSREETAPIQSDKSLDLISKAMFDEKEYINTIVNYLL